MAFLKYIFNLTIKSYNVMLKRFTSLFSNFYLIIIIFKQQYRNINNNKLKKLVNATNSNQQSKEKRNMLFNTI